MLLFVCLLVFDCIISEVCNCLNYTDPYCDSNVSTSETAVLQEQETNRRIKTAGKEKGRRKE